MMEGLDMSGDLCRLSVPPKRGDEFFCSDGAPLGCCLQDFWRWSVSDLVSNATRGRLAEFIVAKALGTSTESAREEWAAFDLQTPTGIKVEVKSAAYVQSWHQKQLSSITFVTRKTRAWDPDTNVQSGDSKRQADVYVFALLAHTDKATVDPLNLDQWRFYVLPTSTLDSRTRSQHSITLKSLEGLCSESVSYADLPKAVERCIHKDIP
jgi:hypothetical protein